MNKVANEFTTLPEGFRVVSPEEMVQCEGGFIGLIVAAVAGVVMATTAVVTTVFTFGFPFGKGR